MSDIGLTCTEFTAANRADSPPDAAELRELAVRLAQTAAQHVRTRRSAVFGSAASAGAAVRSKTSPTDPVTIVDTETEQLIRAELARLRPADHILGEEGGGQLSPVTAPDAVQWVVDPIDGTVNYLYGLPVYAVSVAAVRQGRPVAGAVVDVAADLTYCAARGLGAQQITAAGLVNELRVNPVNAVSMALVGTGFGYGAHRRARQATLLAELLPRVRDIRRMGAAALDLCLVARGGLDAYYEHGLNPWDWAAGALIAAEAGAQIRVPAMTSTSATGELVAAAAVGISDEFTTQLAHAGAGEPIPD